jgi:ubiquitin carboxyl-terminal hydrolase 25/28
LFWNLEYCETAAVTPTIELAKLALVTSKDEEEEEADRGGTDSSNDTDATLVDDGPPRFPVSESSLVARSPSSVLGKRPRRQQSQMEIDNPGLESSKDKDGFVMVSKPASPLRSDSPPPLEDSTSQSLIAREVTTSSRDEDGDVEMRSGSQTENRKPPPLPPRKHTVSESVMMFGTFYFCLARGVNS